MRTVVFNGSYLGLRPTGIGNYALNLWRCWQRQAKPVRAYLPLEVEVGDAVEPVGARGHLARLLWNQTALPARLRSGEVLFNPVPEGPLLGSFAQVTTAHDVIPLVYPEWFPRKQSYFRYLVPACLKRSSHILCDSEQTRRDLCYFYDLDTAKMTVVPLACDRERFYPRPVGNEALVSFGLVPGEYVFYVGAHEPHKNLTRLIEAFAATASEWSGVLAIAGAIDPRYTPDLIRTAERLRVADRVRWLDYLPLKDLPLLYSAARLFAFPSLYEGFGLPVLEAMASGTAVLTSIEGATAEVAGNGAVLVDPHESSAIAAGLLQLLDPAVQVDYEQRAIRRAAEFSWERTAGATWQVIEQV